MIDKLIANEATYNLHTCDYLLSRINSTFYQMPTDLLIPETKQKIATLNKNGPEILRRMQVFRENVKGKFFAFPGSTTVKETCANAVKRTLLYSRYTEEFLAEYLVNSGALSNQSKEILSNHESTIYRGSARLNGKHFIFKNGDVLLVRGIGMNSAMTSRIADEEQYFSHIAIVGKDLTGQLVVVESLKGGLQSTLITEYIKQKEDHNTKIEACNNKIDELEIEKMTFQNENINENMYNNEIKVVQNTNSNLKFN